MTSPCLRHALSAKPAGKPLGTCHADGRNTDYIDTYVREIESEKVLSSATDKVYGSQTKSREDSDRTAILSNQEKIMDMQKQILERLEKRGGRR